MKRFLIVCLSLSVAHPLRPEVAPAPSAPGPLATQPPTGDSLSEGLWWLYQLKYDRARELFERYADERPTDAAGPFYMTATDWWQLAQEFDMKLPKIEERLAKDYERTVVAGKAQLAHAKDDHERGLACLYWGGAEGLNGRWLVAQKQWRRAYFMGKRGNALLHRALFYDKTLYDAYMGIGIYDYFTDTLSGVVGALAHFLIRGDRKRGLRELQLAIENGERARVESKIFLIEIYTSEEGTPEKALPLTQELHQQFPTSPAMHLAEIMAYYGMKRWKNVKVEAQKFLELSEKEVPHYQKEGARPARYCLGVATLNEDHDLELALRYMNELLETVDSSRWVTFAYLRRGQIYDAKGERAKALANYRAVLSRQDFWGAHREAGRYTKEAYKLP